MENFNPKPSTLETATSREAVIIKDLKEKNTELETFSEEDVRSLLATNRKMKIFNLAEDDVIAEMKGLGYFKEPVVEKEEKKTVPAEPVVINNRVQLKGISEVEDEELRELLEQNRFYEELAGNIFKNEKVIWMLYMSKQ